jgi:SOS response regulatory protein OraA/RecX
VSFAKLSLKGRALKLLAQREHSRLELQRKLAAHVEEGDDRMPCSTSWSSGASSAWSAWSSLSCAARPADMVQRVWCMICAARA